MSEDLKPCPFCGSTSIDYIPETDYQAQAIYCDCPAGVEDNSRTKDELIRFWNTRAEAQKVEKQEGITEREKFLMREAINHAGYYQSLDDWLNEVISDAGHTVAEHLSHDANRAAQGD